MCIYICKICIKNDRVHARTHYGIVAGAQKICKRVRRSLVYICWLLFTGVPIKEKKNSKLQIENECGLRDTVCVISYVPASDTFVRTYTTRLPAPILRCTRRIHVCTCMYINVYFLQKKKKRFPFTRDVSIEHGAGRANTGRLLYAESPGRTPPRDWRRTTVHTFVVESFTNVYRVRVPYVFGIETD